MGFFKNVFEKKECAICGGEIGLLGNRKLEDGNMCKACAQKLSPWFSDRKHSTVAKIQEQLRYRESNKTAVGNFHASRTFGDRWKLRIDEGAGTFMIARTTDIAEENPDVIPLSSITSVQFDIDESSCEEKREDKDGNEVSYQPPRYSYMYDFYIEVEVDNPYFDTMRFQINRDTVEERSNSFPAHPFGSAVSSRNDAHSYDYQKYLKMGKEIKEALIGAKPVRHEEEAVPAGSPVGSVPVETPARSAPTFCPSCGAATTGGRFCEFCGSPLG